MAQLSIGDPFIPTTLPPQPRPFNLAQFKQHWRTLARSRGINPLDGSYASGVDATKAQFQQTSFSRALAAADHAKATHRARMRQLVYNRADSRLYPKPDKPDYWIYLFDNGSGAVDATKVELRSLSNWWQDKDLWVQGDSRLSEMARVDLLLGLLRINGFVISPNDTEHEAIRRIWFAAKAIEAEDEHARARVEIKPVALATIATRHLRELVKEVYQEKRSARHRMPLTELLQLQGRTNPKLTSQQLPLL